MSETRRASMLGRLAQSGDGETLTFTASSTGLNRYGFALRNGGWRIDNFNANPVILWMHMDHLPPIGRGRASLRDGVLETQITFDRSDPFAVGIEKKYRGGFMNAVSVGFDFVNGDGAPIKDWWRLSADQINREAFYDLAEVSAVPVPADPKALRRGRLAAGLMDDLLSGFVDPEADPTVDLAWLLAAPEAKARELLVPAAPVLPGNSPTEQRLTSLETRLEEMGASITELRDAVRAKLAAGQTDPPANDEAGSDAYSQEAVQSLLSAATITL